MLLSYTASLVQTVKCEVYGREVHTKLWWIKLSKGWYFINKEGNEIKSM
jgi:hypothetical protein